MYVITPNLHGMQTDEMLEISIHKKCDLPPAHGHTV